MDEDEDCDSEILVIDLNDETIEVKDEINDNTQQTRDKGKNYAKGERSVERHPDNRNQITDKSHNYDEEQSFKNNYVKVINYTSDNDCVSFMKHGIRKGNGKNIVNNYSNIKKNVMQTRDYRCWDNVQRHDQVNMDVDVLAMHARHRHAAELCDENLQATEREYERDVYERRYYMDGFMPHSLDIKTFRPQMTGIHEPDAMTNIAYRLQAVPNSYIPQVNPYRTDAALGVDDYNRHAVVNRDVLNHYRRLDSLREDDEHHRLNRNPYVQHADERETTIKINDYRQLVMNGNPYNYAHRTADALSIYDYRHPILHKYAFDDDYRSQVAINLDPYIYGPNVAMNAYRLNPEINRNVYYPEAAAHMYAESPQVAHTNAYRHDLRKDAYRQKEAALNLNCRHVEPLGAGTNRPETNISTDDSKVRAIQNRRNRINIPHAIDDNKPKPGILIPGIPVVSVCEHKKSSSYKTTTVTENNNNVTMNSNKIPETQHVNNFKPGTPVKTNRADTVILSTKAFYTAEISSNQKSNYPKKSIPDNTNSISDRHQISNRRVKRGNENNDSILSKKAQRRKVIPKNHDVITSDAGENIYKNIVTELEINELAQESNIRFLVVFFTRVKELVKEAFPEFSMSLQKEVESLGKKTGENKVKTYIQYICPLFCSVSTYWFPRFDNTEGDNQVEKHKNGDKICDVCLCIQSCYRLYKNKYLNLLYTLIGKSKERAKDTKEENEAHYATCKGKDTECAEMNKKSQTNSCHSNNCSGNIPPGCTVHKFAPKVARNNITSGNMPIAKQTVEYRLFNALSILTFDLPNRTSENASVLSSLKHVNDEPHENTSLNNNTSFMNKNPTVTVALNMKQGADTDNKNQMDEANCSQDEPNLIQSLSDEINNADIMSAKLGNKLGRKPDAVFICHVCTCVFTYFSSFVSHLQKEHNINGIDDQIPDDCLARKCPFCGIYSKQKNHNDHVKRAHRDIFTHKGKPIKIKMKRVTKRKSKKRKFIFTCLICNSLLTSSEMNGHREKEHKGVNVAKMFTKRLTSKQ